MTTTRTTRTLKQIAATLAAALGLLAAAGTAHATPTSTGDDPTAVAEILRTAQTLGQEFPILGGTTISTAWLPSDTYAQTSAAGIVFNKAYTVDLVAWRANYQADVASGFHPSGCDAPMAITAHEAAHVIDLRTGLRAESILTQRIANGSIDPAGLSGYSFNANGTPNPAETLAESLSSTYCNSNPTASERAVYEILREVSQ